MGVTNGPTLSVLDLCRVLQYLTVYRIWKGPSEVTLQRHRGITMLLQMLLFLKTVITLSRDVCPMMCFLSISRNTQFEKPWIMVWSARLLASLPLVQWN